MGKFLGQDEPDNSLDRDQNQERRCTGVERRKVHG